MKHFGIKHKDGKMDFDNWVIIKVYAEPHYRILGIFSTGNLGNTNEWKLSSKITNCRREGNVYVFSTYTGRTFTVNKNEYDIRELGEIFEELQKSNAGVECCNDEEDWTLIDWL